MDTATSLLQRTKLHVKVTCQAVHAKNSRHMLIDCIDFLKPNLVIVGSRGLTSLKGTLMGSVSHYLVQKSSVPVEYQIQTPHLFFIVIVTHTDRFGHGQPGLIFHNANFTSYR